MSDEVTLSADELRKRVFDKLAAFTEPTEVATWDGGSDSGDISISEAVEEKLEKEEYNWLEGELGEKLGSFNGSVEMSGTVTYFPANFISDDDNYETQEFGVLRGLGNIKDFSEVDEHNYEETQIPVSKELAAVFLSVSIPNTLYNKADDDDAEWYTVNQFLTENTENGVYNKRVVDVLLADGETPEDYESVRAQIATFIEEAVGGLSDTSDTVTAEAELRPDDAEGTHYINVRVSGNCYANHEDSFEIQEYGSEAI